jgi:hypothetical protein
VTARRDCPREDFDVALIDALFILLVALNLKVFPRPAAYRWTDIDTGSGCSYLRI